MIEANKVWSEFVSKMKKLMVCWMKMSLISKTFSRLEKKNVKNMKKRI